jgi:Ca2+-binding RTX toxin-like protein
VRANVENVVAGGGADTLTGNAVRNALTGGAGQDALHGLAGDDVLRASGDGSSDTMSCGAGRDQAFADPDDVLLDPAACERVSS